MTHVFPPSRPLNILMAGLEWFSDNPGGGGRYLADAARGLVERGHRVVVLVPRQHDGLAWEEVVDGVQIHRFDLSRPWDKVLAPWRAASDLCDAYGPFDVVHSHFALYGLGPLWHPSLSKAAHVTQFQGPWAAESAVEGAGKLSRLAKYALERLAYARSERFIVLSEAFGRLLASDYGVPSSAVSVIPAGVDIERFKPAEDRQALRAQLGLGPGPVIFAMRRLVKRMGLDVLIDAFARLAQAEPEAQLLLGGTGPLANELAEQVERLGLSGRVRFLGRLSDEDLVSYYQASDLSVVPTIALEGFGLSTVEALACGTPVVGTALGGTDEILRPFAPQLLVEPGRADVLGDRLMALLSGRETLPSRQSCREYVLGCYTWSRVLAKVEAVLAGGVAL